jgi:hypothetical protein
VLRTTRAMTGTAAVPWCGESDRDATVDQLRVGRIGTGVPLNVGSLIIEAGREPFEPNRYGKFRSLEGSPSGRWRRS